MDMNVPVEVLDASASWDSGAVNLPAISTPVDGLLGQYGKDRKEIAEIAGLVSNSSVLHYFFETVRARGTYVTPGDVFNEAAAIKALNADYWSRAMALTDVLKVMPAKARNEWHENIREHKTPEFEEETVKATILDLLSSRTRFFAEKVDGIFQALSRSHVTNSPEGFSKRMIINHMLNSWSSYSTERTEYLHDLRSVMASFMGWPEIERGSTGELLRSVKTDGKWHLFDGGTFRIRCYKVGTAHIEVHPDIAWRLNQMLAFLYPAAIPSKLRSKPPKPFKEFQLYSQVISQPVLTELRRVLDSLKYAKDHKSFTMNGRNHRQELEHIVTIAGGIEVSPNQWAFDYQPHEVFKEILRSRLIPEQQVHQFYPTQEPMAQEVVDLAEIGDGDSVLEPSSGSMAIGRLLPVDRTQCVEVSALHCTVAKTMGYAVYEGDFLTWEPGRLFDRICMNPPFSQGRAQAHLEKAISLLAPGGKIVAVLPASLKGKVFDPKLEHTWGTLRNNEFKDAAVTVVLLKLEHII